MSALATGRPVGLVTTPASAVGLECVPCQLAGSAASPAEAVQLAGTHDDLLHGGRPTVEIRAGGDSR